MTDKTKRIIFYWSGVICDVGVPLIAFNSQFPIVFTEHLSWMNFPLIVAIVWVVGSAVDKIKKAIIDMPESEHSMKAFLINAPKLLGWMAFLLISVIAVNFANRVLLVAEISLIGRIVGYFLDCKHTQLVYKKRKEERIKGER